ncbi:2-hydroxyacid dehydrogenase [Lentilitoribacter sp. Alg239-R112]|jgi:lactate dehydrogenase-like 2-hydroxyacid dehydrogenase|uniref:2-hydroxyacid dehydrogenase n=1 Tax=Lentilitoribacter sp. Alg239-R112 TaxID=2305987 RepID=UPI0013A6C5A5|nr:2-hydroxyacid dehydrogenase [Lentilitoribacter sp. Alg239-R112]
MAKVEILQIGPYSERDEKMLREHFHVHRYFEVDDKENFIKMHSSSIKAIATRGDLGADRELIHSFPNLEIISVYGVGFDAVDIEAAKEKNIHVTNTPDVLTKDVADLAVAMMLALGRNVAGAETFVKSGEWARKGMLPLTRRVHGKRVGILGLGRIGYEIARRLTGFDMDISYSARAPHNLKEDWPFIANTIELAKNSDILFVSLSASAETKHIINKDVLNALGPDGMVINVSRAANIDETALLDALEAGTVGSAALDVFEGEPHLNPRFLELDNVLLQPHHGSGTVETREAMGDLVLANLIAQFDGKPLLSPVT